MQGLNPITMQCAYSTPCGWCAKWDKKCDKKIGPPAQTYDYPKEIKTNQVCQSEEDHEWVCCGMSNGGSEYVCKKCRAHKFEPYTSSSSNIYKGEII